MLLESALDGPMKVQWNHEYATPMQALLELLTSPTVAAAKYRALGAVEVNLIEHTKSTGAVTLHTRRRTPIDSPPYGRRSTNGHEVVHQRDEWNLNASCGVFAGIWQVVAEGVPVTAHGTMRLVHATDDSSNLEISGDVLCALAVGADRRATCFGMTLERTMHAEEAFLDGFVAGSHAHHS